MNCDISVVFQLLKQWELRTGKWFKIAASSSCYFKKCFSQLCRTLRSIAFVANKTGQFSVFDTQIICWTLNANIIVLSIFYFITSHLTMSNFMSVWVFFTGEVDCLKYAFVALRSWHWVAVTIIVSKQCSSLFIGNQVDFRRFCCCCCCYLRVCFVSYNNRNQMNDDVWLLWVSNFLFCLLLTIKLIDTFM